MLVTAIITTYKREPNIVQRALESIINQTYKNLEIRVVDDSPTDYAYRDEVKKVVESFKDDRIRFIQHERNMGACQARNTGLKNAHGEYIGYLDDDDTWNDEKIEKQVNKFLESEEDVGLVYCKAAYFDQNIGIRENKAFAKHKGFVFDKLILANFIGGTTGPLMKTSCLNEIGGFDTLMESAQDADVWLRLAEKYKINYVDEALYTYYITHEGEQISTNPKKRLNGLKRLYEENLSYLNQNVNAKWNSLCKLAPLFFWNGMYWDGICTWSHAVFLRPLKIKGNFICILKMIKRMTMRTREKALTIWSICFHSFEEFL